MAGWRSATASATACRARRTTATCAGAANSSPTSACAGMMELAFVRSPLAHARLRGVRMPAGAAAGRVVHGADLDGVRPIAAISALPGFKRSEQPVLAAGKVRHVGEAIAACVAADPRRSRGPCRAGRARFRGTAGGRRHAARRGSPARRWCTSTGATTSFWKRVVDGDLDAIRQGAPRSCVRRRLRTARQCMSPIEGRGVVAEWDRRLEQLMLYTLDPDAAYRAHRARPNASGSTQDRVRVDRARCRRRLRLQGHSAAGGSRRRLARSAARPSGALDRGPARTAHRQRQLPRAPLRHHRLCRRRRAPAGDRLRSDVSMPAPTRSTRSPPAWRRRRSPASCRARTVMQAYRCRTWSVATNKPPILPYRGVARAGVCFAMESDAGRDRARSSGWSRTRSGCAIWCRPRRCRSTTSPTSISTAATIPNACVAPSRRSTCPRCELARQAAQAGHAYDRRRTLDLLRAGARTALRSMPAGAFRWCPGFEQAVARLTPDGGLELRVGIQSPRPGTGDDAGAGRARNPRHRHSTASGCVHGDTALTPYSTGTWGSRCMVMAGGAVATACRELAGADRARSARICCKRRRRSVRVGADGVVAASASVGAIGEVARTWYRRAAGPADRRRRRRASRSPPATSRSATAARSATRRMRCVGRGRYRTRRGAASRLRDRRGRRRAGQPDDRRRPG